MTTKTDIWMPVYIGDYLADTMRLSTEQHGAYLLLLMEYWRSGELLDDDEELAAITRLPIETWIKHRKMLIRFFQVSGGKWKQKRADIELKNARKKRQSAKINGKKGGRPRNDAASSNNPEKSYGLAKRNPEESSLPLPLPLPSELPEPLSLTKEEIVFSRVGGQF